MKKTFLLIAALFMMGSAAFADGGSGFNLGIKAGFQTAKLSYDKATIKSDFSNHFTAGLFGRVTSGRLYLQPEILYFKTSNVFSASVTPEENENSLIDDAHVNVTLNQMNLQVPVMIGIKLIDLDLITLRAQAGPTANFVLKSQTLFDKIYSLDGEQPETETYETDEEFDPETIAWGLQAGLGIDVLKRFTLDVNYSFGLSKMFNSLDETTLGQYINHGNIDETRQNLFMVTLGFMF